MNLDLLTSIRGWQRKADGWAAPVAEASNPLVRDAVDALPVFRVRTPWPCATLPFAVPQFFVAVRPNGRRFLVDTEGYDYARYIVALPTSEEGR